MVVIRQRHTGQVLFISGADSLRGADLSGRDLRGADLRGADLREARLSGATVTGADFTAAQLPDGRDGGLFDAYARTTYQARTPGVVALRLGEPCPVLDALLTGKKATSWAFLTAANPGSQPLAPAENERRCAALEQEVRVLGLDAFPGEGVPDVPGWAPERSLLILGLDCAAAIRLGQRWGQLAVVVGHCGAVADLVLC